MKVKWEPLTSMEWLYLGRIVIRSLRSQLSSTVQLNQHSLPIPNNNKWLLSSTKVSLIQAIATLATYSSRWMELHQLERTTSKDVFMLRTCLSSSKCSTLSLLIDSKLSHPYTSENNPSSTITWSWFMNLGLSLSMVTHLKEHTYSLV